MKAMLRHVLDGEVEYDALAFVCPGCTLNGGPGLHMLPVNALVKAPSWTWNGNLELPTLSPSILTRWRWNDETDIICHSFLKEGVFEYLSDCTHGLNNQKVPMVDLPDWFIENNV